MVQGKKIRTINPATNQVLAEYDNMTNDEIKTIIQKSKNTFQEWKKDIARLRDVPGNGQRNRCTQCQSWF